MLKNMKLRTKMLGSYAAIALLIVFIVVLGYINMKSINNGMVGLYKDRLLPTQHLGRAESGLYQLRGDIYKFMCFIDQRAKIELAIAAATTAVTKDLALFRAGDLNKEAQEEMGRLDRAWVEYQKAVKEALAMAKSGDEKGALKEFLDGGSISNTRKAIDENVDKLVEINNRLAVETNREGENTFFRATMAGTTVGVLGILITALIGFVLSGRITTPVNKAVVMLKEMSQGHLDNRLSLDSGDEIGVLSKTMDEFADDLQQNFVATMNKIAAGDLSTEVVPKDNRDIISPALKGTIDSLRGLIAEAGKLTAGALEGNLAVRGKAESFQGGYRDIVQGMNATLDAVVGPLNVAAGYVERISKGDIPPGITDEYKGDFNRIKSNLNVLIDSMNEITRVAGEIAGGNLTVTVVERSAQDKLMQTLSTMVRDLTEVVANIQTVASQVMSGSQEMSTSSEQLSQGATEQSASVEEVSSSMEEMVANINQNSDNAQQTDKIALKAAADAREGGKAVTETVSAMKEIAGKISIIEEIARQTNLLALNAAIEAARAGEHGKGFAVVASEVRKLAERSQTAAGEINRLSASSVTIAEKAGEMLTRIVPDIQKTADLVQEINAASNEQSSGTAQINKAIQQLDLVIQQNASASEEMASTSVELLSQAEQLQKTISFFRIHGNEPMISNSALSHSRGQLRGAIKVGRSSQQVPARRPGRPSHPLSGKNCDGKGGGIALNMVERTIRDKEDEEFERY